MPQGMNPNAAGGPSGTVNGGSNFHQQGQPGGGFVPMFQPGGGPPGAAGSAPYGVQVMMLPQGGMYAASESKPSGRLAAMRSSLTTCFHAFLRSSAGLPGSARSAADGRAAFPRRCRRRRAS